MGNGSTDWRRGKVFYREWSKSGVERTLGALNGEGSWEELAAEYWKLPVEWPTLCKNQTAKGRPPVGKGEDKIIFARSLRDCHPPVHSRTEFLIIVCTAGSVSCGKSS
jgi:hypothetical protein